ncbi:MAG: M16 family metallopeptidase [Flammeovirgaceae bacterium]
MIDFQSFTLENGLQVIVHEDKTIATAAVDILYDVGSKDESPEKTGFAHLFEHLMFGGSKHIPNYDKPLQKVGGSNNAFTSPDITNYYITLPAENLETAFWLESDRMLSLSFDPQVLETQRKVVIEEFKQRYLNQPYGDLWLKLRPLAYSVHPYRWPTIGKDITHIEQASMEDVKTFFHKFYTPSNAIMVVAGNVAYDQVRKLAEKWFGSIPKYEKPVRSLPQEPQQTAPRFLEVTADVPLNAIYKTYHMCGKTSPHFHSSDLVSDILGRGKSSRLYASLLQDQKLFNSINSYITGSMDDGLLVISGKLNQGVSLQEADQAIQAEIDKLKSDGVSEEELSKVKNQAEATLVFSEVEILNRAMNLAYSTLLGDTNLINLEAGKIQAVSTQQIQARINETLVENNCSTLYYTSM